MEEIKVVPVPWYRRKAWVLRNFGTPGFLIGAPIAYVLGMATMWPTGWELPANTLTAITAALTSVAAVGGAIAVWHYQQDQESTATGRYLIHVLEMPIEQMRSAVGSVSGVKRNPSRPNWKRLEDDLLELHGLMARVSSAHIQDEKILLKLDPRAMELVVRWHQRILRGVNDASHKLRQQYAVINTYPDSDKDPGEAATQLEFFVGEYRQFVAELKGMV